MIHLTTPYGAFANVLAFPSAGLVPSGTPITNLSNDPPPGRRPVHDHGRLAEPAFTLVKNPHFAGAEDSGHPGRATSTRST